MAFNVGYACAPIMEEDGGGEEGGAWQAKLISP